MSHLLIFGLGYTATRLAARLRAEGWRVTATRRVGGAQAIGFADDAAVTAALATATHVLSSVPPEGDIDPVIARYGAAIAAGSARWIGYLSSTGVYGDTKGAWVDETAPIGGGRRGARAAADRGWQGLRDDVRVFRLPGIYGPGRSPLDRVAGGTAQAVSAPGQMFSRIHVDDIVSAVIASFAAPAGIYNIADDLPAAQDAVTRYAAACLGLPLPPVVPIAEAALSPAARAFFSENRRVANGKAKRVLGWVPAYPDYRAGLRALSATIRPRIASSAPETESSVQR
jgi:nucleoside-diphosphate-sugar epimerase